MSVRTDLTVDFDVSPRVITIAAPSTSISIQDLWDTLQTISARIAYMGFDALIYKKSGGKLSLGGGEYTGINLVLNDALIGFDARAGPTWAECQITGGNILSVDSAEVLQWPIYHTAFVTVGFRQSTAPGLVEGVDVGDADWLTLKEFLALK